MNCPVIGHVYMGRHFILSARGDNSQGLWIVEGYLLENFTDKLLNDWTVSHLIKQIVFVIISVFKIDNFNVIS